MYRSNGAFRILLGFTFIVLCFNGNADENGMNSIAQRIKNYEFERNKTILSTRSVIIDYIKENRMDSLRLAVAFCDSINSPDSTWLTNMERVYIHFLCVDTSFLYDKALYTEHFGLIDTAKELQKLEFCNNPFTRGNFLRQSEEKDDNLSLILFKTCKSRLNEYRNTYTKLNDIWDFWEIVAFEPCVDIRNQKKQLAAFREKYQKSVLASLTILDYEEQQKRTQLMESQEVKRAPRGPSGGGGGIGASYTIFPKKGNDLLPNFLSVTAFIDVMKDNWLYQIGMDFSGMKTKADLIRNDTLKKGSIIRMNKFLLSIGRPLDIGSSDVIFPVVGGVLFHNFLEDRSAVGFDLPFFIGGKIGVDYNHIIGLDKSSVIGPALRISTGVYFGNFKKIDNSLKYYQVYFSVMVGILGYSAG
jgi:hypothetical protein